MTAANLTNVMDEIGVRLATISGLRYFDFPPKSAQPPFAFVNMPESIDYDLSMARGNDRFTVDVWVGVADVVDRASRDALAVLVAGSGVGSVKAAIEGSTVYGFRVMTCKFAGITLAAGTYSGAILSVDVGA